MGNHAEMILRQPNAQRVRKALEEVNLTLHEREVLELIYMDGLTAEKAAEKMEVSVSSVNRYKKSAVKKCDCVFADYMYL